MKFRDWFESHLIELDNAERLRDLQVSFVGTSRNIVKKVYNVLKDTGLLELDCIYVYYIPHKPAPNYYLGFTDTAVDIAGIFEIAKHLTHMEHVNKLTEKDFKNLIKASKEIDYNKEYYCLLTLNPNDYGAEYIKNVEKILNANISQCNSINSLYHEFKEQLQNNPIFKAIVQCSFESFGLLLFETREMYNEFLVWREEETENDPMTKIIKVSSREELEDLLQTISNDENVIFDDDEVEDDLSELDLKTTLKINTNNNLS